MINSVGEYITAIKTHVDMLEDFEQSSWIEVVKTAKKYDLLIRIDEDCEISFNPSWFLQQSSNKDINLFCPTGFEPVSSQYVQ